MTDPTPLIDREPVRLPVWLATIVAGLIGVAVDLLMGGEWRIALAGFLTTIPPVLLGVEVARGKAWSPASVWLATVQARRSGEAQPIPSTSSIESTTVTFRGAERAGGTEEP